MAVGFTPKYVEEYPFDGLTQEQFLIVAEECAKEMKWAIRYISENGFIAYTNRGMFSWNAEIKIVIDSGIATIMSSSTGSEMMDWGKNKKNVAKFIDAFNDLKSKYTQEEFAAKYEDLKPQLAPAEDDNLKLPPPTTGKQVADFFSIFKPQEGFYITPVIIDLNLLVFILMVANGVSIVAPDNADMLRWGANFKPLTLSGEWWRLITNIFLHIGIFHLLMNMYALLYIGMLLEPRLGKARFLSAYMLTGLVASFTSLWWHDYTISAGASGAIFGMYGVFLAMLTTDLIEKTTRKALLTSIAFFVGYNLLNGLKGGIDNAAHIGGLVSGLIMGYAFIPSLKEPETKTLKPGSIALLTIAAVVASVIAYNTIPNDFATYKAKMKQFSAMELLAMEVYKMPEDTPKDKMLNEIKQRGLYYWHENIKILDEIDKLKLPETFKERDAIMREYCMIRIEIYELMCKKISESTDEYNGKIKEDNEQLKSLLDKIKGVGQEKTDQ